MENMIEVKNFVRKYGDFTAVDHVSFHVKNGSIFAFLGPNGAGKSSTIHTLCTITEKTSGTLLIDGKDVTKDKASVRNVIGVVFQDSTLDNKMTVEENLKMHCHFYHIPKSKMDERIEFVLSIVDLIEWKKAMVSSLSGGMKRRVEIARSLLHFPKVLFLDEPTTGLDPQTRANIWEYIIKLQQERNMTVFLTTHYMDEAEICDKVAVIDHGKIIAFDKPDVLKKKYTIDKAFITSSQPKKLEELCHYFSLEYEKNEDVFTIELTQSSDIMGLLNGHRDSIKDLEIKKGTLNDVFLEITGRDIREG
ncbi:ATP-binding cassette domain-containing protein [Pseudogracilibacillus auburnensis]|uniref:ABC-2 type transport system ATP-binding protein n=1 Tax=Pseudogracilibacillus auburnensis TaxID=1494959 RepID=A0A2V3VLE3_9BACI|nr:ATP-binding cassette domain-containing protein [Pseudogracilibacillus auburnensis]PXW82370.1 ABC-2 type transport system ATP-binding protein [Pseudogracilibacillus auburnensis]